MAEATHTVPSFYSGQESEEPLCVTLGTLLGALAQSLPLLSPQKSILG